MTRQFQAQLTKKNSPFPHSGGVGVNSILNHHNLRLFLLTILYFGGVVRFCVNDIDRCYALLVVGWHLSLLSVDDGLLSFMKERSDRLAFT